MDEVTSLVERGHALSFLKSLDLISFQSLAESSERVWKNKVRFEARQQMISSQGTVESMTKLMEELETTADKAQRVVSDAERLEKRLGGGF